MTRVVEIHRHPIKGFTAERLSSVNLNIGQGLPLDRHFAFVSGRREEEPQPGGWVQARTFLMLTVFPELARFRCKLTNNDQMIEIVAPDGAQASATVGAAGTFADADALLARYFDDGPHGRIRLVEQTPGHGHWDFSDTCVSIINLATVREISVAVGRQLEKERFRGNLYIDGLDPWEEFSWPGCRIAVGDAELEVLRPVQRCAMTSTEPGTGLREVDVPATLMDTYGHNFCGVYAHVVAPGLVAGDRSVEVVTRGVRNPGDDLPERAVDPAQWPRFVTATDNGGNVVLQSTEPAWPLPFAATGQKLRIHARTTGQDWHTVILGDASPDGYVCPMPDHDENTTFLMSGPYGRPS